MPQRSLLTDAARQLALQGGALAAGGLLLVAMVGLPWRGLAAALIAYGIIGMLVLAGLEGHAPHRRFGAANAVTLLRAAYAALLLGIFVAGTPLGSGGRWAVAGFGLISLLLDGVDGRTARRTGLASAFGARFDLETDALFVLVLSALLYRSGQVGAWVITTGLMRYLFVAAGRLWPVLAAPLPPSLFRKAVCVMVILALLASLVPTIRPEAAGLLCLAALALLSYSFGADCVRLIAASRRCEMPALERPFDGQPGRSMGSE